jgi:glycosyltransferase involved in cell wall biosynthesis
MTQSTKDFFYIYTLCVRHTAFVTNSLTGGGAERAVNQVVNELYRRGHPVCLIVCNESGEDLIDVKAPVHKVKREWQSGVIRTIISLVGFNLLVWRTKPKVLILNCDLPEFFGLFCLRRLDLIIVEHVNRPWASRKFLGKFVRIGLRLREARFIAVSEFLTIWPFGQLPQKVIRNPIPLALMNNSIQERDSGIILKRLFFAGRLVNQKQPTWIIDVADRTGLPVVFIGDGELRIVLEKASLQKGIKAYFLGYIPNPWIECAGNDLVVVPSAYEGDGLVVLEAIALRKPILLSDIPEFRRFDLPDKHYCASINDFVHQIEKYRENTRELVVSNQIADRLLLPRNVDIIGDEWEDLLFS